VLVYTALKLEINFLGNFAAEWTVSGVEESVDFEKFFREFC